MPARSRRIERINTLIQEMNAQEQPRQGMELGIELSNELMLHFGMPEGYVRDPLDVLDDAFANSEFSNQKMETWFYKHPILGNARIALHHVQVPELVYESQFYMLSDELSKARVAATANLFSHWEDSELTKFPTYKVGLHFFVSHDGRTFYLVLTKDTNIRVLELNERLSNTQSDILESLKNVLAYQSIEQNETQQTIHAQLWKALELSEVNKRFYEGVADAFMVLVQHLNNNDYDKKEAQLFSSRLLGRLIFIWFLRKKDIIHESMGYFDLINLNSTDYYNIKLKPLFFDTLNTPVEHRKHTDIITPYLNGGLFEAHENDWIQQTIPFPIDWFNQLYEHLNKFNFTTDESTPEYEQVAIDPEMLGRVFENLLATVVPETSNAANVRKNQGAFYTPREIVSFMTKETLKQYLKTKIDNEKHHFGIDQLIDMNDAKFLEQKSTGDIQIWGNSSKEVQEKIISALDSIKILDPACGSGAFPIGMMQLLAQTYERVQAIYVVNEGRHRLAKGTDRFNSYQTKLHIIQSSLFGSDIEPMAIEIARLRTWLSLIIEDMSKIEPLPNLDFSFVCANSLIPLEKDEQISIFDDTEYEDRLAELRDVFFSTHDIEDKLKLKQHFNDLYDEKLQSVENSKRINQLRSWNPFIASEPADFFDSKVMFNTDGFDVVIGNPPYKGSGLRGLVSLERELQNFYKKTYPNSAEYKINIYSLFIELSISMLSGNGICTLILPDSYLVGRYFSKVRKFILSETDIKQLVLISSNVFDNAVVGFSSIILLEKNSMTKNKVVLKKLTEPSFSRNYSEFRLPQDFYNSITHNRFYIFENQYDFDLYELINKSKNTIGDYFRGRSGVISKVGQKSIVKYERKDQYHIKGIISGSQIKPYAIDYQGHYIDVNPSTLKSGGLDEKTLRTRKVLVRQTGDSFIAAIDFDGYCYLNNVHSLIPIHDLSEFSLEALIALLNSKIINSYYSIISLEKGRPMAQIDIETLELIPVPFISTDVNKEISSLVDQLSGDNNSDIQSELIREKLDNLILNLYLNSK